jgi:D-alanyl-D-alanine carboxypeptidase
MSALLVCAAAADWWSYPSSTEIQLSETEGDELAIVVNKRHRLPENYVPQNLVELPSTVIRTRGKIRVKGELVEPLRHLNEAARKEGVDLSVVSGYRSFARQLDVYRSWLRREGGDVNATDKYSARAGHSEHQLGTVVDFSTAELKDGIGSQFNKTKAAKWLEFHANQFGFRLSYPQGRERATGYQHEGWHWRYWGDVGTGKKREE